MKFLFILSKYIIFGVWGMSGNVIIQDTPARFWTNQDLIEVQDGQFRCPESYSNVSEKTRALENFLAWVQGRYPAWTTEQILIFRMAVLKKYMCVQTLNNIQESDG